MERHFTANRRGKHISERNRSTKARRARNKKYRSHRQNARKRKYKQHQRRARKEVQRRHSRRDSESIELELVEYISE